MKLTPEHKQEIFDFLEAIDAKHLREGIVTLILTYLQELVDEGMHVSLDRKFYEDIESLLDILAIREKYAPE